MNRRQFLLVPAIMAMPAPALATEPPMTPLHVVNERMRLYNAHDLEPFLALYSPDVVIYDYPARPLGQGLDHMRRLFAPLFAEARARVEVTGQIAMGARVVNDETVTYPDRSQRYVSIYDVEAGRITAVRFLR